MEFRAVREEDYGRVMAVINDWWGGRQMRDMLPRLFFAHFQDTSFVVEEKGELVGFLIGLVSQSRVGEAYIHFVGVHPEKRKSGLGAEMYERFFEKARERGCEVVKCVTSPVNKGSMAYHTKMGFEIEKGDKVVDGVPVVSDYDGRGGDRVLFVKKIG
jgi:ribosomal protein S18 acetylase RimI-like enzyme